MTKVNKINPASVVSLLGYALIVFVVFGMIGCVLLFLNWHSIYTYISNPIHNAGLSAIGSFANLLIAFVGLLNLVLLARMFFCERADREKEYEHTERLYWTRLALSHEWESVSKFFDCEYEIADNAISIIKKQGCNADSDFKLLFKQHLDAIKLLRRSFGSAFVGVDTNYGEKVFQEIDLIQDEFTTTLVKCQIEYSESIIKGSRCNILEDLVAQQKKRVWNFVFTFSAQT